MKLATLIFLKSNKCFFIFSFRCFIKTYGLFRSVEYRSHLYIAMLPFFKRGLLLTYHQHSLCSIWMKNLLALVLLKHLYHSRHQALNCIEIVGNHVATKGLKNACLHQFQNLITIKLIMTSALKALGKRRRGG